MYALSTKHVPFMCFRSLQTSPLYSLVNTNEAIYGAIDA